MKIRTQMSPTFLKRLFPSKRRNKRELRLSYYQMKVRNLNRREKLLIEVIDALKGNRPMSCKNCGVILTFEEIGTDRKCESCYLDTPTPSRTNAVCFNCCQPLSFFLDSDSSKMEYED